jgi:hypothetical protein
MKITEGQKNNLQSIHRGNENSTEQLSWSRFLLIILCYLSIKFPPCYEEDKKKCSPFYKMKITP